MNSPREPQGTPRRSRIRLAWNAGCLLIFLGLAAAILIPVFRCARVKAQSIGCANNMKQIGIALLQYEADYDQRLPPAAQWASGMSPFLPGSAAAKRALLHCPSATATPYGYAFNAALSARNTGEWDDSENIVLLFESDSRRFNAAGSSADVAWDRHMGGSNVAFADGHVREIMSSRSQHNLSQVTLEWSPKAADGNLF